MTIYIGSARIAENGKITGGKVGDQKQASSPDYKGEVSMQKFYVHKLGWNRIRFKDPEHAKKMAAAMKAACNNIKLGYDQAGRYGVIKYGVHTKTPTECDCSSLYRACFIEATGVDPGDFNTGNQVEVLKKTGLVDVVKYVSQTKTPLYDGDGLVSCKKGHTAVVVSGSPRPAAKTLTCEVELPVLQRGSKGASVKAMQTLIIADGISCGSAGADGDFGAGTQRGLEKYQKRHGLVVDASCGPKTWAELLK